MSERINKVGIDELTEYELEGVEKQFPAAEYPVVAYSYEIGNYDGSGFIAGVNQDRQVLGFNMGHCSCYGPTDPAHQGPPKLVKESDNALDHDQHQEAVMAHLKKWIKKDEKKFKPGPWAIGSR